MSAAGFQMKQADEQYREGRFEEAERLYREAVVAKPDQAKAWERLGILALWRNDLAGATAHFANADRHKNWFARHWPLNVQSSLHRALVHVRTGRMREAARLLDQAAGPFPFGPLREIRLRARQSALFGDKTPYRLEGPAETIIPFVTTNPLPVVQIAVNDNAPAEFVIDTGGEGLILDCAYAQEIGAHMAGEVAQEYAGGKKGMTGFGKVEAVQLGDVAVRDVPVSCLDMQPIAETAFAGRAIKGILGTGLLMQFLATLDYPRDRLVLSRNSDSAPATQPGDHVFPMWLVETHLIFVEGSVNGLEPQLMFIDTGLAGAGFHASQAILAKAGVSVDWSKAGLGAGGGGLTRGVEVSVAQVTLGRNAHGIRKDNLKGVAFEEDLSLFRGSLGFEVGGLVSHEFFRDHTVTLDFRRMHLIIGE